MKSISTEHVIKIVEETGALYGIKDRSFIDSALNRAKATFDGEGLYPNDWITHLLMGING